MWQFVRVTFGDPTCVKEDKQAVYRIYGGSVTMQVLLSAICRPKFMKFWENVEYLFRFQYPLPTAFNVQNR